MLLFKYELKKIFMKKTIIFVVLAFAIINFLQINSIYTEKSILANAGNPAWKTIYMELYPKFSGNMTNAKIDELLSLFRPLEKITSDHTASTATDNPNTFTGNVYGDYYLLRDLFVKPMEYMYTYHNTAGEIVRKAGENIDFYNSLGNRYECRKNENIKILFDNRSINEFAYTEAYMYYTSYDFSILLILLICIFGISNVFVREKESQMDTLLLTNISGGKKTISAKIRAVSIFVITISLCFSLFDFIGFMVSFGTAEGYSLPIFALKNFITSPLSVSLWQYVLLSAGIRALGIWALAMIFLLVSMIGKNALASFIINIALSFAAITIWSGFTYSENVFVKVINPFSLVYNNSLFSKTEFLNCFGIPILSFISAIVFGISFGILSITLIYKFSKRNAFC